MKTLLFCLAFAASAAAQHEHMSAPAVKAAMPLPGLGAYHHAIRTSSAGAQKFFDQGLNLYYGFNHEEAIRAFEQAAKLDPKSPMPGWGKSLSLGRNYNRDEDPALEKAAYEALQTAMRLADAALAATPDTSAAGANGGHAAAQAEYDYVTALSTRYSQNPNADHKQLALAYKNAMGDLMRKYPDDLEAATLYAESAMNLRPWLLWNKDGSAAEGTAELVGVLESVLRRDPLHPGANHLYIHAVEASPNPERALASAARIAVLVPGAGHLVHMPAHIYSRVGDFDGSAGANEKAAAADRAYVKLSGATGMYPMMYYSHNLHFLVFDNMMRGNSAGAKLAASQLIANVTPGLKDMPMLEEFLPAPTLVALRFHHWQELLALPAPADNWKVFTALHRFARGVALAATGKVAEAEAERAEFAKAAAAIPAAQPFGLNSSAAVMAVASAELDARIAAAKHDTSAAINAWTRAVIAQDALSYDEPPDWYYPVRESLGGALLSAGRAADAEKVFRQDLVQNPRNPRSLFGLAEALAAQGKAADEAWVRAEFAAAWKHADVKLKAPEL